MKNDPMGSPRWPWAPRAGTPHHGDHGMLPMAIFPWSPPNWCNLCPGGFARNIFVFGVALILKYFRQLYIAVVPSVKVKASHIAVFSGFFYLMGMIGQSPVMDLYWLRTALVFNIRAGVGWGGGCLVPPWRKVLVNFDIWWFSSDGIQKRLPNKNYLQSQHHFIFVSNAATAYWNALINNICALANIVCK